MDHGFKCKMIKLSEKYIEKFQDTDRQRVLDLTKA